jgi:alpha-galactosidase
MGWRSWNFYACEINATVFERQVDALADRSRMVDGKFTSLLDLGYATVGIDDCWQDCTSPLSLNGSYHSADGTPLVDASRFPDGMRALSDKAAAKGVGLGWYNNNCPETHGAGRGPKWCGEHGKLIADWPPALKGDVAALIEANFSSVKLDNPACGANSDMQQYYDLVRASTTRPIVIENCHFNTTYPRWVDHPGGELACPMHLYRVSDDIKANWPSVMSNVAATIPFADATHPLSGPGCWAYPDMLEVGVSGQYGKSEGGLSFNEMRTHFALWSVVSSPLTLSFDLGNATLLDAMWPIIANPETLAVSQSYFGHPGTLADQDKDRQGADWQVWVKPQADGAVAVLLIARALDFSPGAGPIDLSLALSNYVGGPVHVRDLWGRKDLGRHEGTLRFPAVAAHDSVFLLLKPGATTAPYALHDASPPAGV